MEPTLNWFDRVVLFFAPKWGAERVRARLLARHFEAASFGRRTSMWSRKRTDANATTAGSTLPNLRSQARDLVRNNPWARRGLRRLVVNTVGWGIRPKATGRGAKEVMALWKRWGETTECDAAGRLNFYGLQRLVMRTIVESGEVLIRRRRRRPEDELSIPLQLQVLEPDYLDTSLDGIRTESGGRIVQGVEFDTIGRRVAYWLFDEHPGSAHVASPQSRRHSADGILHIYDLERPGQVRGVPWFASVDVRLHDFHEFEDATLMKQKIASCMAAFVTDEEGAGTSIGRPSVNAKSEPLDVIGPGMIMNLAAGRKVTVANPPPANDFPSFSTASLRGVAAGLGVTYEDLTGDMTQVNFSSARMGRIAHTADIYDWQWNMLIPQFLDPVWGWVLEAALLSGANVDIAPAKWTPPAMPMIDPDREGMSLSRMVRAGAMTIDQMVSAQGYDPDEFFEEYAAGMERLDELGIVLDSDARRTNTSGQQQSAPGAASASGSTPAERDDDESEDESDGDDDGDDDGGNAESADDAKA